MVVVLSVAVSMSAWGAPKRGEAKKPAPAAPAPAQVSHSQSHYQGGGSSGIQRTGFGFTTFSQIGVGSLSGLVDITDKLALQPFLSFGTTSPFQFGVGALGKYTLIGNMQNGFHGGAGFHLGTLNVSSSAKFYINMVLVAGIHFMLTDKISISFDGGPQFQIINSSFNFAMSPFSAIMGMSAHYIF